MVTVKCPVCGLPMIIDVYMQKEEYEESVRYFVNWCIKENHNNCNINDQPSTWFTEMAEIAENYYCS